MSNELTAPAKIETDPISAALVAAGVTTARIEQLAKDFGELAQRTEPIETEEEYEVVKRAQLSCRDVRTAVTAALKDERDEAIRYQKFVLQEERRILSEIAKTEEPLKKLREDYDNREQLRIQEAARLWQERMNLRKQAAFDIGYYFNGQHYLLDRENGEAPWVLSEDQLAGLAMTDEALFALLDAQAAELKLTREIKAEAEAKAEDERLAKEAAAKAEADRIAAAQAEIERKEREMAEKERKMNALILQGRLMQLKVTCGPVLDLPNDMIGIGPVVEARATVAAMSDERFIAFLATTNEACHEQNKQREALHQQQEQERIAREEQLKAEAAQRAIAEERERVEREREAKEKEEALRAQQEAEKAAQASDKEKVESFAHKFFSDFNDNTPELKSAIGQAAMKTYYKQVEDIYNSMIKLSKEL